MEQINVHFTWDKSLSMMIIKIVCAMNDTRAVNINVMFSFIDIHCFLAQR